MLQNVHLRSPVDMTPYLFLSRLRSYTQYSMYVPGLYHVVTSEQ